ncbi:MAG: low molecular weight protein-tyrosine-phosphatase [Aquirhabdus sp.]
MSFQNILVVCIGNICRSPMAEALLKQTYPDKNISSAGIEGLVGYPADPLAIECMSEVGIDISAHVARRLDSATLVQADLVFVMTAQQVKIIEERWGFTKGKVFRLCHWRNKNISDPYQKEKPAFVLARDLVQEGVDDWGKYL